VTEKVPYQRLRFIRMHKELLEEEYGFVTYDPRGPVVNCLCGANIVGNFVFQNRDKDEVVLGSTCAKRYRMLKEAPEQTRQALALADQVISAWPRLMKQEEKGADASYDVMKRAYLMRLRRLNAALLYVGDLGAFLGRLSSHQQLLNDYEKRVLKTVTGYHRKGIKPTLKQLRVLVKVDLRIADYDLLNSTNIHNYFFDGLRKQVIELKRPLSWKQIAAVEQTLKQRA